MTAPKKAAAKKPAPKKPATKKPAPRKPAKPRAASGTGSGAGARTRRPSAAPAPSDSVLQIALNDIAPSPLNPRKSFDEASIAELAASIAEQGQLQNISVRKVSDTAPRYHIIFGERRWRAMSKLAADGVWKEDAPVSARIVEADEGAHLELAILENLQREEVHPLEQAEAFARLAAIREQETGNPDEATRIIAEKVGQTPRNIQYQLQVARNLSDATKQAWTDGRIGTRKLAIAIARQPVKTQAAILDAMEYDPIRTPAELSQWLRESALDMKHALFTLEDYTAAGGSLSVDPETDAPIADDEDVFLKLQSGALKARAVSLTEALGLKAVPKSANWYGRTRGARIISEAPSADLDRESLPQGAFIEYAMQTYSGETWLALVAPEDAAASSVSAARKAAHKTGKGDAEPEVQPYARKNWIAGAAARTACLRKIIASSPEMAMALTIISILPSHIDRQDWSEHLVDVTASHRIADQKPVEEYLPGLPADAFADIAGIRDNEVVDRRAALQDMLMMKPARLAGLFALLIASRALDLRNRHQAGPGTTPEGLALSEWAEWNRSDDETLDEALNDLEGLATGDWFTAYTLPQLNVMAGPTGCLLRAPEGEKRPGNRAGLAEWMAAYRSPAWIAPEARFTDEAAMQEAVSAMLEGKAA